MMLPRRVARRVPWKNDSWDAGGDRGGGDGGAGGKTAAGAASRLKARG